MKTGSLNLRFRRLVTFCLLFVVLAWVLAVKLVSDEATELRQSLARDADHSAVVLQNESQLILHYADNYIRSVRRELLRFNDLDAVHTYLAEVPLDTSIVSHITVSDREGRVVFLSRGKIKPGSSLSDRDYFKKTKDLEKDQLYLSLPHKGRNTGKVTVRLVRPMHDANGDFYGVIFAAIEDKKLMSFFNTTNQNKNSFAILIGNDSVVRAHSKYPSLSQQATDSISDLWGRVSQETSGAFKLKDKTAESDTYHSYRHINEYPLIALTGLNVADIEVHLSHFRYSSYGFAALISIGVSIALLLYQRTWLAGRALEDRERTFRRIIDNMPIGMSLKKKDGTVTLANKQLLDWWGVDEHEALGRRTDDITKDPPEAIATRQRIEREAWETGKILIRRQADKQRPDGNLQHISISKIPVLDDDGVTVALCTMIEDVTERVRAENVLKTANDELENRVHERTRELEMARDQAEAATLLKSQLITTMSHELRTPLTSIIGSLRLITEGVISPASDDAEELLEVATRNGDQLALLVNDILDTEKLDSKALEFNLIPLDLTALVEEALVLYEGYGEEYKVRFLLKDNTPDIGVLADRSRLLQVMANLLSNAAKFSKEGGVVSVSVVERKDLAEVRVTDTGMGIPEDLRPTIFEKFVRGDNNDARNTGGTGLGLYIARSIVDAHKGTLGFQTEVGKGTTFMFTLPLVKTVPPNA